MGFFTSFTEKIGGLFSAPETRTKKTAEKVIALREHVFAQSPDNEPTYSQEEAVISMDRTQDRTHHAKAHTRSDRQEAARLANEVFDELKNLQRKSQELTEAQFGKGVVGELNKDLRTTLHGNLIRTVLWGEAALLAYHAVQSEAFANLGNVTAIGAVVTTLLLSRQAIKSVSETIDYYFRGERSKRKEIEQARKARKHFKNERRLMAKEYRDGTTSAEEYIHYAAQLVSDVRKQEEKILNGGQYDNSIHPPIAGLKESMKIERTHKLQRAIGATIAAPVVNVLIGGQQLGINEWDMVSPAHRVEASLAGLQFYSTKIADAVGTSFKGIPHQVWSAFAIGATSLVGKTIQEAATLAKKFDKRDQEERIIKEMEASIDHMKELEGRIQGIADNTPYNRGRKRLNAEHMESLRYQPPQAAPNDFSDLAAAVEKNKADEEKRNALRGKAGALFDKMLGRETQILRKPAETAPLTAQDFGESPSLFRAECLRKAIGTELLPGTLLAPEVFMGHLEQWLSTASDIDVIDRELYFSNQLHQYSNGDADESIKTSLDEASRRCAAERLGRIKEKTVLTSLDPNALRAQLLVLLGMEDEIAVGQKYFEKLFAQGYVNASRLHRLNFNKVMCALDLSLNISDVSRKREKNIIFESVRNIIAHYEDIQEQAA